MIAFQILDSAELRLPFKGPTVFEDPETGLAVSADPDAVRESYAERLHALLRAYRREMRANQMEYLLLDTSTPFHKALIKFLLYRRRRH